MTPMPLRGARVVIKHKLKEDEPNLSLWLGLLSAQVLPSHPPYAYNYGGHQFGHWAGQLGDGRSICLGFDSDLGEVCLKGSGATMFSRKGDGRAALANACREYLADTALIALGIPAFRSLSLITSEQHDVFRDGSYAKGRRDATPAVILARTGPSFVRVGSVQLIAKRQPGSGLEDLVRYALRRLHEVEIKDDEAVRYYDRFGLENDIDNNNSSNEHVDSSRTTIRSQCFFGASRDVPSCAANASHLSRLDLFRCLLSRVSRRVAALAASWHASGFAHGVLNTDNLSLFGSTIDLNVFGFISRYDPNFTPNFIDTDKRYSYEKQASAVKWDLLRLADALTGTRYQADREQDSATWMQGHEWLKLSEAQAIVKENFDETFPRCTAARFCLKLGLSYPCPQDTIDGFLALLQRGGLDFHRAFRALASTEKTTRGAIIEETLNGESHSEAKAARALREAVGGKGEGAEEEAKNEEEEVDILRRWGEWLDQYGRDVNATRVLLANPEYILRTVPLQSISALADARMFPKLSAVIEIAEEILRCPFEKQQATSVNHYAALEDIPLEDVPALRDWVLRRFRESPTTRESLEQTSCGAQ